VEEIADGLGAGTVAKGTAGTKERPAGTICVRDRSIGLLGTRPSYRAMGAECDTMFVLGLQLPYPSSAGVRKGPAQFKIEIDSFMIGLRTPTSKVNLVVFVKEGDTQGLAPTARTGDARQVAPRRSRNEHTAR